MGMGIRGVWLLSTIIAAAVVLGLEIAALACGTLGIAGNFIGHWLAVKAKKHDEVWVLAESKLSISDHVSSTLIDGRISDEEFHIIVDEVAKYQQLKSGIWAGAQKAHAMVQLDVETKNYLIQQGKDEAKSDFYTIGRFGISFRLPVNICVLAGQPDCIQSFKLSLTLVRPTNGMCINVYQIRSPWAKNYGMNKPWGSKGFYGYTFFWSKIYVTGRCPFID